MDLQYAPAVVVAALALTFLAASAVLHARVAHGSPPWTRWWRGVRHRARHTVRASSWSMTATTGSVRRGEVTS